MFPGDAVIWQPGFICKCLGRRSQRGSTGPLSDIDAKAKRIGQCVCWFADAPCKRDARHSARRAAPGGEGVSEAVSQRQATGADTSQNGRCPHKKAGAAAHEGTGRARAGVSRLSPQDMAGSRPRRFQHGQQGSATAAQLLIDSELRWRLTEPIIEVVTEAASWPAIFKYVFTGRPSLRGHGGRLYRLLLSCRVSLLKAQYQRRVMEF